MHVQWVLKKLVASGKESSHQSGIQFKLLLFIDYKSARFKFEAWVELHLIAIEYCLLD